MIKAPEIIGETWFNSKPLSNNDLKGKVVLYDFWTYSCVNCLRTLPYLREWWKKYKEKDFLIIGIHTPEFDFEKDPENVRQALKELDVKWPVVLDDKNINWNNFSNMYWPAKYLADKEGKIIYEHFGEGAYEETENKINELLSNHMKKISPTKEAHIHGAVCFRATPELYCGYKRGFLSKPQSYHYDHIASYEKPAKIDDNSIALSGRFFAAPEYLESFGPEATLNLNFTATEVNQVLEPVLDDAMLEIKFNGKPLSDKIKGQDIKKNSMLYINKPRMYNIIEAKEPLSGTLTISPKDGNFRSYAFTFSGCIK